MSLKDYKICEHIYSNEYGTIEKVTKEENDTFFLMKRMNKKYLKNKNENEVLNEIENISSIKHQNLSEYKSFFFDEHCLYLIMEYDNDSEFYKKIEYNIKNHLSFEENYLWSLTIQLLNLLKFMKDNNNIKFNFTSLNILLMDNGLLKIFDYSLNYEKLLFNEDSWMNDIFILPPEIINENNNINFNAVNIWKAGCIIYELCTLKPQFNGKSNR